LSPGLEFICARAILISFPIISSYPAFFMDCAEA
jgi:hypothetical protein